MKFNIIFMIIVISSSFLSFSLASSSLSSPPKKYDYIFNFGDSLSDTGNLLLSGALAYPVISKLPYGVTFFGHPTGRCSDGRLIVDFIAEAFGLPFLTPYLAIAKGQSKFQHGANFAVSGATALDSDFYYKKGIGAILWTNNSLSIQLGWFNKLKSTLCTTKQECGAFMKKSLFLVGEIGGNDYNYNFFLGRSIKESEALVPIVVETTLNATSALIEEGAVDLVVPGNLPIGCSAVYLTLFQSQNKADYDQHGCLKAFNAFSRYYNANLKQGLEMLRKKYPYTKIMYADYYGASIVAVHTPMHHGFYEGALKACCGGGGPYNFNISARCGHEGSAACKNPSAYTIWDGIHLTEAAYHLIAKGLINGPFTTPSLM